MQVCNGPRNGSLSKDSIFLSTATNGDLQSMRRCQEAHLTFTGLTCRSRCLLMVSRVCLVSYNLIYNFPSVAGYEALLRKWSLARTKATRSFRAAMFWGNRQRPNRLILKTTEQRYSWLNCQLNLWLITVQSWYMCLTGLRESIINDISALSWAVLLQLSTKYQRQKNSSLYEVFLSLTRKRSFIYFASFDTRICSFLTSRSLPKMSFSLFLNLRRYL